MEDRLTNTKSCLLRLQMVRISMVVAGIELCYSAQATFLTPLLLHLGVPTYLASMGWILSPALSFFVIPVLGSMSDRHKSRLGRRRPFIIIYGAGILVGLLLIPSGEYIGELFGDYARSNYDENSTSNGTQEHLGTGRQLRNASSSAADAPSNTMASSHLRGKYDNR